MQRKAPPHEQVGEHPNRERNVCDKHAPVTSRQQGRWPVTRPDGARPSGGGTSRSATLWNVRNRADSGASGMRYTGYHATAYLRAQPQVSVRCAMQSP